MSKRTATVMFELTKHQSNQIQALGHALWPDQHLHRDEICRRVLLDATDRTLPSADGERLLEVLCQPAGSLKSTVCSSELGILFCFGGKSSPSDRRCGETCFQAGM
jgi:hypothetical protein